jgi:hypothetical protein
MLLLLATLLLLLIPVNPSAYKENSQLFATVDFFKMQNTTNLLEKLNLLILQIRHCHFDALFIINVFSGAKCCPSVLKAVGICVLGASITLPCSVASLATALQLDMFMLQMQFVNLQMSLETQV